MDISVSLSSSSSSSARALMNSDRPIQQNIERARVRSQVTLVLVPIDAVESGRNRIRLPGPSSFHLL